MKILFPSHPLHRRRPDPEYADECQAASQAGFQCEFYDVDRLREGNAPAALTHCAAASVQGEPILYRGWMLRCWAYGSLHRELTHKDYRPMVSAPEYAEAHFLPNAYPLLDGHTPESRWLEGSDVRAAWKLYEEMASDDVIVKDFVMAAKHRWHDACFIPAGTGYAQFKNILLTFLYVRGDAFEKGFVFRRAHPLISHGSHACGRPKHEEARLFFWNGELLASTCSDANAGPMAGMDTWSMLAKRFRNPFVTLDIARRTDGNWLVIESGDGGVSEMPERIRPEMVYEALKRMTETRV